VQHYITDTFLTYCSCSLARNIWYNTTSRAGHENRMWRNRVQP